MSDNIKKPIRVLHVVGGMNRGGTETWLMHILRNTDRVTKNYIWTLIR
ncbi:MAG: hypothetical protein PWQ70_3221 [Clostridiales bacterium]|nr:hypothetical protein [Clostridiales bacterium]